MDRCWTSSRLQRHHLQNNCPCTLCSQEDESIDHLILTCVYSREVWFRLLRAAGFQHLVPSGAPSIVDWWPPARKHIHNSQRKGFDTMFALVAWSLWLERNERVFNNKALQAVQLANRIRIEGLQWSSAAGFSKLGHFFH
jgi:hypothetical protein